MSENTNILKMTKKKSRKTNKCNKNVTCHNVDTSKSKKKRKIILQKENNSDNKNENISKGKRKKSQDKIVCKRRKLELPSDDSVSQNDDTEEEFEVSDGNESDSSELRKEIDSFIKKINIEKFASAYLGESDEYESPKKINLKNDNKNQPEPKIVKKQKMQLNKTTETTNNGKETVKPDISMLEHSKQSLKSKKKKKQKNIDNNLDKSQHTASTSKIASSNTVQNPSSQLEIQNENCKKQSKKIKNILTMKMKDAKKENNCVKDDNKIEEKCKMEANKGLRTETAEKKDQMMERLKKQLQSASFRLINQNLYTTSGSDAYKMFQDDKKSFELYHEGYTQQVAEWPMNPLNMIINWLGKKPKNWVVADFGCGAGTLAKRAKQKVHSFDLIASGPGVIECNMAHTPLQSKSVDVVVFCLSLMGTNLTEFIVEANRVLVDRGVLKVAEIESRFEKKINEFLTTMSKLGFKCIHKNQNQNYFWLFDFLKVKDIKFTTDTPELKLKPCMYKKR